MNSNLIIDYCKKTGKIPVMRKGYHFAEPNLKSIMPIAYKMPPSRAVEYLKKKGKNIISSEGWDSLDAEAHDKAFTVSKVTCAELLQTIYDHVEKAKSEGQTLKQFRDELLPKLKESGWTGATPSRLKVIYDTNMQMASAHGQYKRFKLIANIKPYWIYTQIERTNKRHDHALLNGKKFRHDDPIWDLIYPPSGFGCKCSVTPTKDGSGVENGADYLEQFKDSEDFQLTPLKPWKPETDKYVEGIKQKLEEMMRKVDDPTGSLPDCDWLKYFNSSFSKGRGCTPKRDGQKNWKDYGLESIDEMLEDDLMESQALLKKGKSNLDALKILREAIGLKDTEKYKIIKTPIEEVIVGNKALKHIAGKRDEAREIYANYLLPTLEDPIEIYKAEYTDGTFKNHYISVFKGDHKFLVIVRINTDGTLYLVTFIHKDREPLDDSRIGELLYKK